MILGCGAKLTQEVIPSRRQMIQLDNDIRGSRACDRAAAIF
jgi:hypothetical protein